MCIQTLVSFCQFVLKILGKNQILTSIKGRNSLANLRKTTIYYTKVDLVNDNVYTNLILIGLFVFKILSKNSNSDVNQGQITLFQICRNSNSSKLSCMSSLPARMMLIKSKMKELECSQDFEFVRDVMDVLVTCKYEEDPIKNEGARVDTTLYSNFSDGQGQITLVLVSVSGRNLNSSKLSCMSSLPARMRMIDSKMKELECSKDFSHYKSMGIFSDAQGQLTPQSLVQSGRISNSQILWMFSLPASMKKIRSKMKALEWTQHFPHYNPMGAIRCHGNQSSNPTWSKI